MRRTIASLGSLSPAAPRALTRSDSSWWVGLSVLFTSSARRYSVSDCPEVAALAFSVR